MCLCGVQFIIGDMKIRTSECEGSIMACATFMMHGAFLGAVINCFTYINFSINSSVCFPQNMPSFHPVKCEVF